MKDWGLGLDLVDPSSVYNLNFIYSNTNVSSSKHGNLVAVILFFICGVGLPRNVLEFQELLPTILSR